MEEVLRLTKLSLEWHEEDQYSFIWKQSIVFVKVDRDNGHTVIISYHSPEVKKDLYRFIYEKLNPWIKNKFIGGEESGD